MSRESIVIVLAIIIFFVPLLGLPEEWRMYIASGAGAVLFFIGLSLRRSAFKRRLERAGGGSGNDSHTEHNGRKITPPETSDV